jgi:integrase
VATAGATGQRGRSMQRTCHPGVYRRGRRYVVVYRHAGRQRKESAPTLAEARELKIARDAEARVERLGPTLHDYALTWARNHGGLARDSIKEQTREEYRRLLSTFVLRYFSTDLRLRELDRRSVQGFISWLVAQPGRKGRLTDRSVHNAVTPLRLCLESAESEGLASAASVKGLVLPRRRYGCAWHYKRGRAMTRDQLSRLLAEIPDQWQLFFSFLASTGLRVSEAIALRWCDVDLDGASPHLRVSRSIVKGVVGAPKSRFGRRSVPIGGELAHRLLAIRPEDADGEALLFRNGKGGPLVPNNIRNRVLLPAIERASVPPVGFHAFRHTCASLLIERGLSPLRVQRWMGHHSAAYTLDVYGHLIDGDLAPPIVLSVELAEPPALLSLHSPDIETLSSGS